MIRVTLADGTAELIEREIEPRRPGETLYDFMLRSAHETSLEARALRALLDAHVASLARSVRPSCGGDVRCWSGRVSSQAWSRAS